MFSRSMTLLNGTGDTTIAWTPEADAKMLEAIQKKLDAGFAFFITAEHDPEWMKKVKKASEIKNRKVLLLDDDLSAMFLGDEIGVAPAPQATESTKLSRDPKEIVQSRSIAVRAIRGG